MFQKSQLFQGKFTQDCQNLSVTPSLLALVNMILYDPDIRKEDCERNFQRQAMLSISQLLSFNSCKQSSDKSTTNRHNRDKEYPLPVLIFSIKNPPGNKEEKPI